MNLELRTAEKRLEQEKRPFTMSQFKITVEQLFQLHRIGLLNNDDVLALINGYVKLIEEEAQDAKVGKNGRSRY